MTYVTFVGNRTAETCLSSLPREKTVEPCPAALMNVSEFVTVRTITLTRTDTMSPYLGVLLLEGD
ncbi:MAG: hypothetical protein ACI9BF_000828 [Candidatus Paceibacteria bacterium]